MPLNDFTIKEELGKGAFGSVYLVKRNIDGQEYAMKRVKIIQLNEKEKENALNEIRILASLNHKNIIGYNEAFFDQISRTLNIVMEYANDGDLSRKIKYNLKNKLLFREDVIWDYLIQILEGINYLHENKIMHRDLKSANIFLMDDGTIKIGDLNVSKISEMGIAFTQIGTPYYASPEIWMDKSYDYKSDIWSIGCIIYELCMLKPPFRGTSIKNLAKNIQKGVYEQINNFYSDDLKKIISMMLVLKPENRPSSYQLLKCDIISRHIKKENGGNINFLKEEKADLIKTIKMPRNLREINRNLPMKRYKKIQREEMFMNDEYETMKTGFLKEKEKDDIRNDNKNLYYENEDKGYKINNHIQHNEINKKNLGNNGNNNNNNYKNPWFNDNYKNNYERFHQEMLANQINNKINKNNHRQYGVYSHKQISNGAHKNIDIIHKDNINRNNLSNVENPKTPNLINPNYRFNNHINHNIHNIHNNNNMNNYEGRKIENIQKNRPKTGSNIPHRNNNINNNNINNRINNVNLNLNVNSNNNNKIKKEIRPVSSAVGNRGGYIYKNNNIKQQQNQIYNNKNRPLTGNPNNKINPKLNNFNLYQNNQYANMNKNIHQHNLNNDFKLRNGKNIIMNNPHNNKKKKVIIEKMNYKPQKNINNNNYNYKNNNYGNNKFYNNNNVLIKGKNDKMREYERERIKNVMNKNNVYNYRDYVKKVNSK